ncbi:MAG: RsmB/NOP family class I SAM-dependent RNA methyltransferase [Solobacterium sp.]|nr:RsmB/NOP family class I SAM-dependent RNA methyltransferase [Solobacterium sp.]
MNLPESYLQKMKGVLQDEYESYLRAMQEPPVTSIRINTGKITVEEFQKISPFPLEPVPWCREGFYVPAETRPGTHPYYYAGLYYIQEASAMTPASLLPVEEGDIVLDACAAPGGKTTALAAKLNNTGILISNDISASRQNATLKNCERFGIRNAYLISSDLRDLAVKYPGYFDKILVDVPCSGEGMFRRDPSLVTSWLERGSEYYPALQKEILSSAVSMLKEGGTILYSTCTFDPAEDEEVIRAVLKEHPDLYLIEPEERCPLFDEGIGEDMKACVRLYPHRLKGEGHFAALLKKQGNRERKNNTVLKSDPVKNASFIEFMKHVSLDRSHSVTKILNDRIYLLPELNFAHDSVRVIRSGLLLGTLKRDRFEPSQHLAYALKHDEFDACVSFSADDIRIEKYLRGETVTADESHDGWVLVCVDGYPLGFGRMNGRNIKNKLEKGYRRI